MVRLANLVARRTDQLAVFELGHTVAAVFGGLTVLATIVLARRVTGRGLALAAGLIAVATIAIAQSAPNDTRSVVERLRAVLDGRDAVDWYATFPGWANYPPLTGIDGATDYIVLVQETADRFARAATFAHQSDAVRAYA